MMFPKDYFYTKTHEWARIDGTTARIGLTSFAAEQLGDIVFVELPDIGKTVRQNEVFGVVESVKAVSDCYSPVSGKVVAVNEALVDAPETLNTDPHGDGWIIEVELSNAGETANLLDGAAYNAMPKEQH